MTTNPEEPEVGPTRTEQTFRYIIAGHPAGATRRIALYCLLAVLGVAALAAGGTTGVIFGGSALIVLLMLAMTDQLA